METFDALDTHIPVPLRFPASEWLWQSSATLSAEMEMHASVPKYCTSFASKYEPLSLMRPQAFMVAGPVGTAVATPVGISVAEAVGSAVAVGSGAAEAAGVAVTSSTAVGVAEGTALGAGWDRQPASANASRRRKLTRIEILHRTFHSSRLEIRSELIGFRQTKVMREERGKRPRVTAQLSRHAVARQTRLAA
jgi:hypothetical protein